MIPIPAVAKAKYIYASGNLEISISQKVEVLPKSVRIRASVTFFLPNRIGIKISHLTEREEMQFSFHCIFQFEVIVIKLTYKFTFRNLD